MIATTSRYAGNAVVPVQDAAGTVRQTILELLPRPTIYRVSNYVWTQGDRLDRLAVRAYGSEDLWWLFAGANPEVMDWTTLAVGTVIRVPHASL